MYATLVNIYLLDVTVSHKNVYVYMDSDTQTFCVREMNGNEHIYLCKNLNRIEIDGISEERLHDISND